MKKIVSLLLPLMLGSCFTSSEIQHRKEMYSLELSIRYNQYEDINRMCFFKLDDCYQSAVVTCHIAGEKPKMPGYLKSCKHKHKTACFQVHEKCIINNYRKWMKTQKVLNKKYNTKKKKHDKKLRLQGN